MGSKGEGDFPYDFHEFESAIQEKLKRDFRAGRSGFVQVGKEDKWFLPRKYEREAHRLYNFEVRASDVWVITFPRSGTTWTQEMVWLIANNLDYDAASRESLPKRFPFFEYYIINHEEVVEEFLKENAHCSQNQAQIKEICRDHFKQLETTTKRRFIKTHLPFSLLPPDLLTKGCKILYVARNPKDVAVSYYHLSKLARNIDYSGTFEKFWEYFVQDLTLWSPYWEHIKEGWERRNHENVLFLFYEDLCENLRTIISEVAKFLGKTLTEADLDRLEDHLKFEHFRRNKCVNSQTEVELGVFRRDEENYVRKGVKGGWKEYFNEKMKMEADQWIKLNERRIGIKFN